MKISYLKLKNIAGLKVGSNLDEIEIDFNDSHNRIISIIARNGSGKSVLISTLTPFAYTTALDERSTLPLIIVGKDGYKEIRYVNGMDEYIIKHYYKASKDTHSVKSYFSKNGEELNDNGNVTSFNDLVQAHFGLTQEMMRLVRIGTNVNSFITLTPARRKEYVGKLIEEIDIYMSIYKKVTEDIRVVKTMLHANNTNLYNCHITDIVVEEEKLADYAKAIKRYEKERDQTIAKISKIDALIQDNDIDELRRKKQDAQSSILKLQSVEKMIEEKGIKNMTLDDLIKQRSIHSEQKIDMKSKVNSYRMSIDSIYNNIERLETSINKITSDADIQVLSSTIARLREEISSTNQTVVNFVPLGSTSEEVYGVLAKLQSFNQISKMILAMSDKSISTYIKLRKDSVNITAWLKEQSQKKLSRLNTSDIKELIDRVFQGDEIITPNCDTEFNDCPFYRFHEVISEFHDKLSEEMFDDETLRSIQVIDNNIANIMYELDRIGNVHLPDRITNELTEAKILKKLESRSVFFDLFDLETYLSILKEYEVYTSKKEQLKQYEHQLVMYHKSGIDSQLSEIQNQKKKIDEYNAEIKTLNESIISIDSALEQDDENIKLITEYNDGKRYAAMFKATLESTEKILKPLENAASERAELNFSLRQITDMITMTRENHRTLEAKIGEYNRLVKEGAKLSKKNRDLSIIQDAVSTKKGIPVIYMKQYLSKIQALANELLDIIYDGEFKLAQFNVTTDTFEVPYVKNGKKIPDIKYASQSELALGTMALSFALSNQSTGIYNIILVDELDAGLDSENRALFLRMLYKQMEILHAEQIFIISHNLAQMTNVPMDCIMLGEVSSNSSKLQHIIYKKE